VELLQALVHELEGETDGHGGDDDADEEGESLQARRGADEVAGLEVLRGVAGLGRCDADYAADGDGQCAEGGSGPAVDEEDGRGGHEGGDGHAGDGLAELPMRPTMRELTVTKRKPKKTISTEAARLAQTLTCAPGRA